MRKILCLGLLATSACAGNMLDFHNGKKASVDACTTTVQTFSRALWGPVVSTNCYGCHQTGGLAASVNAKLVFAPENTPGAVLTNLNVLRAYALQHGDTLIAKPSQQVPHLGGLVLAPNSPELGMLKDFVANANTPLGAECPSLGLDTVRAASTQLSARSALRKASLRLAGRLPTAGEAQQVSNAASALPSTLDGYIDSPAFWDRFADEWNLAILTDRYVPSNGGLALFGNVATATWYEPASKWPNAAMYQTAMAETNKALAREPLNIINYMVRNNRPFGEAIAGNYTVVNPYSACALGVQNKVTFKTPVTCSPQDGNAYDPYDFQMLPVATGLGGVLTTRAYLNAHSTTPTNRNRHRVHQTMQAFLGVDILSFSKTRLSPSAVSDPNPTLTNAQCTVCHAVMDPIAGTFQSYDALGNVNNTPWYTDVFAPGYMGTAMPAGAQPLQWGTAQMVGDIRFARNTVTMVWGFLNGAPPVALSSDPNEAATPTNYNTYALQEDLMQQFTADFVASNYNVRALIKEMAAHPTFAMSGVQADPNSLEGEVAQAFVHPTVMSPQALDRRIAGVLGTPWADNTGARYLTNAFYGYYGGVDSVSTTTGVKDFSSMMSNITLRMAAQMACVTVPHALSGDTSPAAAQARATLFPAFDLATNNSAAAIKANLQQMHWTLLGEEVAANGPEVQADYDVFTQVQQQLAAAKSTTLPSACAVNQQLDGQSIAQPLTNDPNATVQAWMATVAYMLGDIKFLTE